MIGQVAPLLLRPVWECGRDLGCAVCRKGSVPASFAEAIGCREAGTRGRQIVASGVRGPSGWRGEGARDRLVIPFLFPKHPTFACNRNPQPIFPTFLFHLLIWWGPSHVTVCVCPEGPEKEGYLIVPPLYGPAFGQAMPDLFPSPRHIPCKAAPACLHSLTCVNFNLDQMSSRGRFLFEIPSEGKKIPSKKFPRYIHTHDSCVKKNCQPLSTASVVLGAFKCDNGDIFEFISVLLWWSMASKYAPFGEGAHHTGLSFRSCHSAVFVLVEGWGPSLRYSVYFRRRQLRIAATCMRLKSQKYLHR